MATELKMKRSSVASKVPTTSQLELGEIAINTYDGKMYIKKDDGTAVIVEVGGGNSSTAIYERDGFTATSNQTQFTITSNADVIEVYMNGLLLNETDDYTVSNNVITLVNAATAGDELEIINYIATTIIDTSPTVDDITFNDNDDNTTGGTLLWDGINETLKVNLDANNELLLGQEQQFYVKASSAIAKGDLVMFNGAQGDHLLAVKLDQSASGFNPEWVMGIAKTALSTNDFGYVTSFGKITELDTSSFSDGDLLYSDPSVAGGLTTTEPTPSQGHSILVAAVSRAHATEGSLIVRISHSHDTDETPEGSTNLYYTDARVDTYANSGSLSGLNVGGNITVTGTVDGRDVATDGTKLDGIEANADVTDSTNVDAAGAVMNSDTSVAAMSFVIDEDTMVSDSATKVPTQQSVKAYVDTEVAGLVDSAPGTLDTLNELAAALGDDPNFATTVTNNIATKVSKSGDTMTGDLSFGDNDKAIFGAGSDLQIYHDASTGNSYIWEQGTGGELWVLGTDIRFANTNFSSNYARFVDGGEVELYYGNQLKFETTSTGVDITGTANADAFSLNAGSQVSSVGTFYLDIDSDNNSTGAALNITSDNKAKFLARFQEGGDISFYEETGTTPKFFWDASTEGLGIGTTSPSSYHANADNLVIQDSGNAGITIATTDSAYFSQINFADGTSGAQAYTGILRYAHSDNSLRIIVNTGEKMRIDSSGNIGIGTTSPNTALEVKRTSGTATIRVHADHTSTPRAAIEFMRGTTDTFGGDTWTDWKLGQVGSTQADFAIISHDTTRGANERLTLEYDTGNVGIGTSSPGANLHIASTSPTFLLDDTDSNVVLRMLAGSTASYIQSGTDVVSDSAAPLVFGSIFNATEWMRIDSSGRVMIGTTTNANVSNNADELIVGNNTSATETGITLGSTLGSTIRFNDGADAGSIEYGHSSNYMRFSTANSERMRIDSSGNLLVGTTDDTLYNNGAGGNTGVVLRGSVGNIQAARSDGAPIDLNRLDDDGDIAVFQKDGTTVGSIGTNGGQLFVASIDTGLQYNGTADQIRPCNGSGAARDAAIDLGDSTRRFKDLYLSGTAYVGDRISHDGDSNTYVGFTNDSVNIVAGGVGNNITPNGIFINDGSLREDYDALSGTSPTCNVNTAAAFSLSMSGNTTFTFTSPASGYSTGFILQLTGNGGTITWPSSVDWAGGTIPDAPASGETDIYVFWTRDGGTTWYGMLAIDAAA